MLKFGQLPETKLSKEYEAIKRRYIMGETCEEIADTYGVHYTAVRQVLLKHGVRLRPRGKRPIANGDTKVT